MVDTSPIAIISEATRFNHFISYLPISMQVHCMTHTMHLNISKDYLFGKI